MNNSDPIEIQMRDSAPTLPPHLRNRVLSRCEAQRQQKLAQQCRANWRLAWGFAAVCALHWFVGGALDAQRQALLGSSHAPLHASTRGIDPADVKRNMMLRSRLLAELTDPRSDRF